MAGSIDTVELLTVAQAAYRINGSAMLKESTADKIANGVMVKAHYYEPSKHRITIIDDDRTQAVAVRSYITQRVMLARLAGTPISDFAATIADTIEKDTVSLRNIGLLAWAPKVCADLQRADDTKQKLSLAGIGSNYIGAIGNKVELEFTTIGRRWSNNYQCWRYSGHDAHGNLVGFLSKNDYPATVQIKGRIKAHEIGRESQGKTTYLNYTRALKV